MKAVDCSTDGPEAGMRLRRVANGLGSAAMAAFLCAASIASPQTPEPSPAADDIVLVATLFEGPVPGEKGEIADVPLAHDAWFTIGARIESVKSASSPWPSGKVIHFHIHSPALTFGDHAYSGHRFQMTLSPRPADGSGIAYRLKQLEPMTESHTTRS
jgi:hypothetical protein